MLRGILGREGRRWENSIERSFIICAIIRLRIGCCEIWSSALVLKLQMFWDIMLYQMCVVPEVLKERSAFMLGWSSRNRRFEISDTVRPVTVSHCMFHSDIQPGSLGKMRAVDAAGQLWLEDNIEIGVTEVECGTSIQLAEGRTL